MERTFFFSFPATYFFKSKVATSSRKKKSKVATGVNPTFSLTVFRLHFKGPKVFGPLDLFSRTEHFYSKSNSLGKTHIVK